MSLPIVDIFGASGVLSKKFPGYEERSGQVKMASAVEKTLSEGGNLLVDAPTGTGKSVAYLAPAVQWARENNVKVLVVTAGIALQEQLIKKDLPLVASLLPDLNIRYAIAKGINNYLCLRDYNTNTQKVHLPTVQDQEAWDKLGDWADQTRTGDFSELTFELTAMVRHLCATNADECTGRECHEYNNCYAQSARDAWWRADVLVTNYHMYFLDLLIREQSGGAGLLPDYGALILDEAHEAGKICQGFFGFSVSSRWIQSLAKTLGGDESKKLTKSARAFFAELEQYKKTPYYQNRIMVPDSIKEGRTLVALLQDAAVAYDAEADTAQSNTFKAKLRSKSRSCAKASDNIQAMLDMTDPKSVFYIEAGVDKVSLEARLVDVAQKLNLNVFSHDYPKILTSATLATGENDFRFIRRELGVGKATELCVESPFDFSKSAVIIPKLTSVKKEDFHYDVAKVVEASVRLARGRTLCLFTSWKALETTYKRLQMAKLQWPILKQGDLSTPKLIQRFKDEDSVLLGVDSLWAGIDIPGDRLSCLIIDRLPFASPGDPIMEFINAKYENAFMGIAVPEAARQLKQGVGRLIRTVDDYGVIVIADPRILTSKQYGKKFLAALPKGIRYSTDLMTIKEILK